MKKVINGKKYDTSTATFIDTYTYKYPSDFEYFNEDLYQKKTGEFFLDGEGGAASKYAQDGETGGRISGSKMIPLTETEAQAWVEKHADAELYEELWEVAE